MRRKGGEIIVTSSIAGLINESIVGTSYMPAKAAVNQMTVAIALEYAKQGIRCNAICPGTVDTPSLHERIAAQGDTDKARAAFVARQPMGRLGEASEIAALVVYLASDESSYTTGATHVIDGGWNI